MKRSKKHDIYIITRNYISLYTYTSLCNKTDIYYNQHQLEPIISILFRHNSSP